jgi:hypothetical protein
VPGVILLPTLLAGQRTSAATPVIRPPPWDCPACSAPCEPGSAYADALFCNVSTPASERAKDLVTRLNVSQLATILSVNGGAEGEWVSEELGLHTTGFTECAHASGSPHGSVSSPTNSWRVTVFPAPMTTARAFSHEVTLAVGRAIGRETRAKHNNSTGGKLSWTGESSLYCMAPMINVCQDVRWGRCQEGRYSYFGHLLTSSNTAVLYTQQLGTWD